MATSTPWTEAIARRRQMREAATAAGVRGMHEWQPAERDLWIRAMDAAITDYEGACVGISDVDPRAPLIDLIAIAGAAIDAMGDL